MQERRVQSLCQEDPLEKEMATHPVFFGSLSAHGMSVGNSTDRGAWWTAAHGVAKSQTRLSNETTTAIAHVVNLRYCLGVKNKRIKWHLLALSWI